MRHKRILLVGTVVALGVAAILPGFSRSTNCGGNSAALARVHEYALLAQIGASQSPDHVFRVDSVADDQRRRFAALAHSFWIPKARFLVSTAPLFGRESKSTTRRVLIVCDTPYTNVPRRWIGQAPATHAAGFSDGGAGLITPAEFAALDRTAFAFLDELYPAN